MIDYTNLKNSYITTIQIGLMLNTGYEEAKRGNTLLHKFCESCIDNCNCGEIEKQNMKRDLELVKEALSHEIELHFRCTQQR